jgi:hypothetical protein
VARANTQFDASFSGWPSAWAFFVGLLQAAYTLTGYGMVAALCEEVRDPVREVPRAMGEFPVQVPHAANAKSSPSSRPPLPVSSTSSPSSLSCLPLSPCSTSSASRRCRSCTRRSRAPLRVVLGFCR